MSAQPARGTPDSSTITASGRSGSSVARSRLRRATLGMIVGLMIQFAAGMLVNLFTKIPDGHPGSSPSDYLSGSLQSVIWAATQNGLPALAFHTTWGLLLVVTGAVVVSLALGVGRRAVTIWAVLGFLFLVGAGFNGASFLDFNEDYSSMIMATLFGLAVLAYGVVLFLLPADG
jgi:hypothetical protein